MLTPAVWKRILRRLASQDSVWEGMREDRGRREFSYGLAVWDEGKKFKTLGGTTDPGRIQRAMSHVYDKL